MCLFAAKIYWSKLGNNDNRFIAHCPRLFIGIHLEVNELVERRYSNRFAVSVQLSKVEKDQMAFVFGEHRALFGERF